MLISAMNKMKKRQLKIILLIVLFINIFSLSNVSCDRDLNKTSSENLTSSIIACNDDEKCKEMMSDRMQKFDDYIRDTNSFLHAQHTERLKHSSVIYGLIVTAEENHLNQQCYREIMQIYHGINRKEIWAMKSESVII